MNYEKYLDLATPYLLKVIISLVILLIGWQLVKLVERIIKRIFARAHLEATMSSFLINFLSVGLKGLLILIAAGTLGVQMTSLIALLGGMGIAIGMALSGTLQNFAGGIVILVFKPYKVGDYIEAQGLGGTVREIQIFNTILTTPDNKTLVIPNAQLSNQSLTNFSTQHNRRVDLTVAISYQDDIALAKRLLQELVDAEPRIIKDLNNQILVSQLSDTAVNIVVRSWVTNGEYWNVYHSLLEKVKTTFDQNKITIPVTQRFIGMAADSK